ncbi:hypothetical protein NM688_g2258 [Phlebia brevispora]|uniref:Uncharacterized protein n=1 Tax=Phlebia brevispora TaxID=194682 RepID=A0ACC1T936_9APHY|nr:hypothetical protein NM688_g2258 [Phlebia brevispora]
MELQSTDSFIDEYNRRWREERMRYEDAHRNGSIAAAHGPPARRPRLVQLPQYAYGVHTQTFQQGSIPPITFYVQGGRVKGIRLANILAGNFPDLVEPNELLGRLSNTTKTTYRLRVVGYTHFDRQMPAYRMTAPVEYLTRQTVAHHVAIAVQECIQRDGGFWVVVGIDGIIHNVPFSDLRLMELRRVSEGSWQPVLAFYRD